MKYRNQIFYWRSGSSLVRDWWLQWRSLDQPLQKPVVYMLAIKLNNSSSKKSFLNADRVFPDNAAYGAVQERRKRIFWEVANGSGACCDAGTSSAFSLLKFLVNRPHSVFNAILGNIAVLCYFPSSSGSHHFMATRDLCPGQSSITYYNG